MKTIILCKSMNIVVGNSLHKYDKNQCGILNSPISVGHITDADRGVRL